MKTQTVTIMGILFALCAYINWGVPGIDQTLVVLSAVSAVVCLLVRQSRVHWEKTHIQ